MQSQTINAKYFCGIDLHKDNMFICVVDSQNKILVHKRIPANFPSLSLELGDHLSDTAVGIESTFNYYWLQDACRQNNVQFFLGHALYMRVGVHKKKDDKQDSYHIAQLMRNGNFPFSYPFPPVYRGLRELLRSRLKAVRQRASYHAQFYIKLLQYNGWSPSLDENPFRDSGKRVRYIRSISDPGLKLSFQYLHAQILTLNSSIQLIEKTALEVTQKLAFQKLRLLTSVPGIGNILGMTILVETEDIGRFKSMQNYSSYCRLVHTQRSSSGKTVDSKNQKSGNVFLKWAYSQAACLAIVHSPEINALYKKLAKRKGAPKARAIVRHKLAVAVYQMLKYNIPFDIKLFTKSEKF